MARVYKSCIKCGYLYEHRVYIACPECGEEQVNIKEKHENNSDLQRALDNFKKRFGVTFDELCTSKEAQTIARQKLDEETEILRNELLKGN